MILPEFVGLYRSTMEELNRLGIPASSESVTVVAGGAMLLLGLRDSTDDMDIQIPSEMYYQVKSLGLHSTKNLGDLACPELLTLLPKVDLHPSCEIGESTTFGVRHQSPAQILLLKKRLNRPKDQVDIARLTTLLENSNEQQ